MQSYELTCGKSSCHSCISGPAVWVRAQWCHRADEEPDEGLILLDKKDVTSASSLVSIHIHILKIIFNSNTNYTSFCQTCVMYFVIFRKFQVLNHFVHLVLRVSHLSGCCSPTACVHLQVVFQRRSDAAGQEGFL